MGFLYYMMAFWPLDFLLGLWGVPSVLRPQQEVLTGFCYWARLHEAPFQRISEDVLQCCTCPSCHRWMCLCKHGWESAAHSCSTYLSIYCRLHTRSLVHVGVPSRRNTPFWQEEANTSLFQLQEKNVVFHHCKLNLDINDSWWLHINLQLTSIKTFGRWIQCHSAPSWLVSWCCLQWPKCDLREDPQNAKKVLYLVIYLFIFPTPQSAPEPAQQDSDFCPLQHLGTVSRTEVESSQCSVKLQEIPLSQSFGNNICIWVRLIITRKK